MRDRARTLRTRLRQDRPARVLVASSLAPSSHLHSGRARDAFLWSL
ncbi:MAG: hypothetical protein AVDCRST_MAG93-9992 [uncultured Chloroflexia bacterium]|uniref:Uncharacterized protein n=1 Tax=uncultured Chloroflexia bacterium TaxID=1672391 RepID=A0A6J4NRM7_9CHLR|nr:MAG: hypothetical protein AVDCRST_MAG93-9992 [uncultured Chloroflexia bacterium]